MTAPTPETDAASAMDGTEYSEGHRAATDTLCELLERERDRLRSMRDELWLAGQCAKLRSELSAANKARGQLDGLRQCLGQKDAEIDRLLNELSEARAALSRLCDAVQQRMAGDGDGPSIVAMMDAHAAARKVLK